MADNTKPLGENAEYTFTGGEVTPGASVPEAGVSDEFKSLPPRPTVWRRLLIPLSIVGSILLIYFGFNFYSSKKNQLSEQEKVATQTEAAFIQKPDTKLSLGPKKQQGGLKINIETGSDVLKTDQMQQLQQMQNAVQQKVDTLMQQMQQTTEGNQNNISILSDTVTKMQQDVSNVNQKIEQLTTTIQQISQDVGDLKASLQKPKKKNVKPLMPYHVRAIVPGRAWLESANGESVTLRVGDKLEGYGVVRLISPHQGMVIMSNGSIIQYGIDDF